MKALLVIDLQVATVTPLIGQKSFLERVNQVIDGFHQKEEPVIFIKQAGCGPIHPTAHRLPQDIVVEKQRPNAFTSSNFQQVIAERNIDELFVVGLMSNSCVQATCKGALAKKLSVTLISDAHDSIIKPMRQLWNKKLANQGVVLREVGEM